MATGQPVQYVDQYGNPVAPPQGGAVQYVNAQGQPVDAHGNLLATGAAPPAGQPVQYVDQYGNPVTANGQPLASASPQPTGGAAATGTIAGPGMFKGTISDEGEYGTSEFGTRLDYSTRVYVDLWATVLFGLTLLGMFIGFFTLFTGGSNDNDDDDDDDDDSGGGGGGSSKKADKVLGEVVLILFICCVVGVLSGIFWMAMMRQCAAGIIKAMLFGNLALWIIAGIVFIAIGQIGGAVFAFIFAALFGLYMWCIWRRIELAGALLAIGSKIIARFKATIWNSFLNVFLMIVWIIWWIIIFVGVTQQDYYNGLIGFLLTIVFYWVLQVLKNISHVTTCGVTAVWFFSPEDDMSKNPTWASWKQAVTKSFGAICFGSLLIAIIQAIYSAAKSQARNSRGGILACICLCILQCIKRLMEWFNMYAMVQVAVYGSSFWEAAKATWNLIKSKGLDAWINDDLTGFCLGAGCLVGALITGIVAALSASLTKTLSNIWIVLGMFVVGFIIGYMICQLMMFVIRSAVVALFVLWGEDPYSLSVNHPKVFEKLNAAWQRVYGGRVGGGAAAAI